MTIAPPHNATRANRIHLSGIGSMIVKSLHEGDNEVLVLEGKLDTPNLNILLKSVRESSSCRVVVDLSGVRMIDSRGLGSLIYAYNLLTRQHRTLAVRTPQGEIRQLLHDYGLELIIPIEDAPVYCGADHTHRTGMTTGKAAVTRSY